MSGTRPPTVTPTLVGPASPATVASGVSVPYDVVRPIWTRTPVASPRVLTVPAIRTVAPVTVAGPVVATGGATS